MNAYEKSIELGLVGTDPEQVVILKSLTVIPIPTSELRVNLRLNGLLIFGQTIKGILVDANIPDLDLLIDALQDPDTFDINTHTQEWGPNFHAVVVGLLAASAITQAQYDGVLALGGGLAYPNLSTIEFAAQRDAAASESDQRAALDTIRDRGTKAYEAAEVSFLAGETPALITAAGVAGWGV